MKPTQSQNISFIVLIVAIIILIPVVYGLVKALPSNTQTTSTTDVATSTTATTTTPVVTTTGPNQPTQPVVVPSYPYIQYITPVSAQVGTTVTLSGSGFDSTSNIVIFGDGELDGVPSTQNGTILSFVVPTQVAPHCEEGMACAQYMRAITPGAYNVSIETAKGTSNTFAFNVIPAPASQPKITSLSPTSGRVGSPVTIYGTGFLPTNTVLFDGGPVNNTTVARNGTALTFTVPNSVGADCQANQACPMYARLITNGENTISVRNTNGTSNSLNYTVVGGTTVAPTAN